MDFGDVIDKYDGDKSYFYVDPPYWKTESYYSNHDFDRDDHERLCNQLKQIKGKFSLSYYDFDLLSQWLPKTNMFGKKKNLLNKLVLKKMGLVIKELNYLL